MWFYIYMYKETDHIYDYVMVWGPQKLAIIVKEMK